jgi:hypothetical protein
MYVFDHPGDQLTFDFDENHIQFTVFLRLINIKNSFQATFISMGSDDLSKEKISRVNFWWNWTHDVKIKKKPAGLPPVFHFAFLGN